MTTRSRSSGFTLIEIVVAVAILAFISLFTVQTIQRALNTKTKVQKDVDKTSTLRDALRVIERDINMAFNYRDINIQLFNQAQTERRKAAEAKKSQPSPSPTPAGTPAPTPTPTTNPGVQPQPLDPTEAEKYKLKEEKIYTQFLGTKDRLDFTTLSNVRITEDSKVSQQAEVGYSIKPCKRRSTQVQSPKCLWRRISSYLHEDITKNGAETVLLENVAEFKLRYLGPGKDEEWTDTWISDSKGDDSTKGKFPYAVEITIEVKDTSPEAKDKSLRMTSVASIRNPNNPKQEDKTQDPQGTPGAVTPTK